MRVDPIEKYFIPLKNLDVISPIVYTSLAILSLLLLLLDRRDYENIYDAIQIIYVSFVLLMFLISHISFLYLRPRAEGQRRVEFMDQAFGTSLTHERTQEYYNNKLFNPSEKITAQVLENSFFSKNILQRMLVKIRIISGVYAFLFVIAVLCRRTDLDFISIIAQVVFGEHIASQYLRSEWLRMRFEKIYDEAYDLLLTQRGRPEFDAKSLLCFANYEIAKATAGISMSSKIFILVNRVLSQEWVAIQKALKID